MKQLILLFVSAVLLTAASCSKSSDNKPDPQPVVDSSFSPAKATLLKQGSFSGNMSYTVSGVVKLYEFQGKKYLHFETYNGSSGPDLRVYISTTFQASQFVSLGAIKTNAGTQTYLINNPPDFTQFNKILIWCQQFSVLFGSATLQ